MSWVDFWLDLVVSGCVVAGMQFYASFSFRKYLDALFAHPFLLENTWMHCLRILFSWKLLAVKTSTGFGAEF